MHIASLHVANFRGAYHVSLSLDKRLNILTGPNGSGKSTICDAINILMSCLKQNTRNIDVAYTDAFLSMAMDNQFSWTVSSKEKSEHFQFDEFTSFFYYNTNNIVNTLPKLYSKLQNEKVRETAKQFTNGFTNLHIDDNYFLFSKGEQYLIDMASCIAHEFVVSNPSDNNPFDTEGVIVIDSVDNNLHPLWQRIIISQLLKVFPNCQFIISTNSPLVINQVQPNGIFMLNMHKHKGIQCCHPLNSYGQTVERVLEDIMGLNNTRPNEIHETLNVIYEYIDKGNLSDAKDKIEKLRQILGPDPDLTKANVLISRKEIINK